MNILLTFWRLLLNLIKEQRIWLCICRLRQNPDIVQFIFTDSWKAKYVRHWRGLHRGTMSLTQKEFAVQFINCSTLNQPLWYLSCLILVSKKQLNLNITVFKRPESTISYPLILWVAWEERARRWQENYYVNQGKTWLMWLCKTPVRSLVRAKDNILG